MDQSSDVVLAHADGRGRRIRLTLCAAIILGTVLVGGSTSSAAPPDDTSGTAKGLETSARWWQVAITNFDTFFVDSLTGDNCVTVDLPSGPIVLVAGSLGEATGPRACTVPANATLVLPVINQIFFLTDPPPADRVGEARLANAAFVDEVTMATATIDGASSDSVRRIRSARFLVDGTLFGSADPLVATSDGYWLVTQLGTGVHHVSTFGATPSFTSSTTYTLTVL
jgi:hypothetical protein